MDPPEPIHGVIGVDRALGLRVTVRELPLMSYWEATLPTPIICKIHIMQKNIQFNLNIIYERKRNEPLEFVFDDVFQGFSNMQQMVFPFYLV